MRLISNALWVDGTSPNVGRKLQRVHFATSRPLLATVPIAKSSDTMAGWNVNPSAMLQVPLLEN